MRSQRVRGKTEESEREGIRGTTSYRASSLMRLAHISKNSMVWLPGRGRISPMVESTEDVKEEAREPSAAFPMDIGGVEGADASPFAASSHSFFSFFRVVRLLPTEPERWGVAVPDFTSTMSSIWNRTEGFREWNIQKTTSKTLQQNFSKQFRLWILFWKYYTSDQTIWDFSRTNITIKKKIFCFNIHSYINAILLNCIFTRDRPIYRFTDILPDI